MIFMIFRWGVHFLFLLLLGGKIWTAATCFSNGDISNGLAHAAWISALGIGYCASILFAIYLEVCKD